MILNFKQTQDIMSLLQRHTFVLIAEQLGLNYLSQDEINILLAAGIDINQYKNSQGIIDHAFLFGILAEAIGDERAKKMSYAQFQDFIKSGNFVPLTEEEQYALDQVKKRAYTDIKGLGNRIAAGTSNTILKANAQEQDNIRKIIKEKAVDAVKYRKSATQLASELGHATADWERDWLRIAKYIMHDAYNYGRAQSIYKTEGEDAMVYFDVLDGACEECRELYLTDPDDITSEPINFKLSDVLANGNNIGRKRKDWKPTVAPVHPFCRCSLMKRDKNYDWDWHTRAYTIPKKYKPKNKKLQDVKLNIKVSTSSTED